MSAKPDRHADIVWAYDEDVDLRSAVFQALGAASMCWEHPHNGGVFESERAEAIGEALLAKIAELTAPLDGGTDASDGGTDG